MSSGNVTGICRDFLFQIHHKMSIESRYLDTSLRFGCHKWWFSIAANVNKKNGVPSESPVAEIMAVKGHPHGMKKLIPTTDGESFTFSALELPWPVGKARWKSWRNLRDFRIDFPSRMKSPTNPNLFNLELRRIPPSIGPSPIVAKRLEPSALKSGRPWSSPWIDPGIHGWPPPGQSHLSWGTFTMFELTNVAYSSSTSRVFISHYIATSPILAGYNML